MKWNKSHFTGVDFDDKSKTSAIWLFEGKSWAYEVDEELGNCDYLLALLQPLHGLDLLTQNQDVCGY